MVKQLVFLVLIFCGLSTDALAKVELQFTEVLQVIESRDSKLYIWTDNGIWQLDGENLVQVKNGESKRLSASHYQHLLPTKIAQAPIQRWTGLGVLMLFIGFAISLVFYHQLMTKRKMQYVEQIEQHRNLLDILQWASEDTIMDCDLVAGKVKRLSSNNHLNLKNVIHFLSQDYINNIHQEDRAKFKRHFDRLVAAGDNNYELNYRISDGLNGWLWINERGCVIKRSESGEAVRIVSNLRNETDLRKEQDNLLRLANELEKRLKLLEAST